jgi:hypothetical protein
MHIYINILFTLYYLIYIQLDIKIKEEVFLYYQEVKYSNEEIITYISYIIDLYDIKETNEKYTLFRIFIIRVTNTIGIFILI